jgi:hypothetical protein
MQCLGSEIQAPALCALVFRGQHRRKRLPGVDTELLVDVTKVGLHRLPGHEESLCDLRVRQTAGRESLASRPAEPRGGERELLAQLAAEEAVSGLELGPLDGVGVQALIERGLSTSSDAAFLRACVLSTGGNPFFITELVRVVAGAGIEPDADHATLATR